MSTQLVKARAASSAAVWGQRRARWLSIASLLCGLLGTYTGRAEAHSLLDQPAPRDHQDGYKDGSACGVGFDAAQPLTHYMPGQSIQVQWLETVDHPGCFLVELSAAGDRDFQVLGRKSHSSPPAPQYPSSAEPRHWSLDVTLPAVACSECTLRLRQWMLDADVSADACTADGAPPGSTYTTCANITVGSADGAPATPPADESSCSLHGPPGHSLVLALVLAAGILRRRRK
jgi:hypothetical protein